MASSRPVDMVLLGTWHSLEVVLLQTHKKLHKSLSCVCVYVHHCRAISLWNFHVSSCNPSLGGCYIKAVVIVEISPYSSIP